MKIPEWILIAKFGTHSHPQFEQVFMREHALEIKASFSKRLEIPIYIGAPDSWPKDYEGDRSVYGWIVELKVSNDGLYGKPEFNQKGIALIQSGTIYGSGPQWSGKVQKKISGKPILTPNRLIAVGLHDAKNGPIHPNRKDFISNPLK